MSSVAEAVEQHLRPLIGLPLSVARRAADMRVFHFGEMHTVEGGSVGEWALHVQCPWRVEGPEGIVTGRLDLWEPVEKPVDWDTWDYEQGNLQDRRMREWLGASDPGTRSYGNTTGALVVEQVAADDYGGATLHLSAGYRLVLFPASSTGEDWRVFQPETDEPHFVVHGGGLEPFPGKSIDAQEIEAEFRCLLGEPLTDMWRYAGCQKFEFGLQRPFTNSEGEEITRADLGLVVSCDWRLTGPEGPVVSSDDFGPDGARRDAPAHPFYALIATTPPVVESVAVNDDGALCIQMSAGYTLDVRPEADLDPHDEQWRLMRRGEPNTHFVLCGNGLHDG